MKARLAHFPVAVRIVVLLVLAEAAQAEEITPFRLTGVEGYTTLQYVSDDQTTAGPGSRSRQAQSGWRTELFEMTHSYVYHPNLLSLDISGGPVLQNQTFVGDAGDAHAHDLLYNFSARATLLRDKPYTGALFFSHLNPTISVAPGQVLTQENTRYGFDFSLLSPVTPVPLQLGYLSTHSLGRGADRLVDDKSDQINLTASRSFGKLGSTQVQLQSSQQTSLSGSQNLPIQSSTAQNRAINVDTRLQFGADQQYDLTNLISVDSQKYTLQSSALPDLTNSRFLLDLRARHSEQLNTFGSYHYNHSSQGELDSLTQAGSAGLNYRLTKNIETGMSVRAENNETRQMAAHSQGVDGNIRYDLPLAIGVAQANYAARYDNRSQTAAAPQTGVLGESLTLSSSNYVALSHPNVIAGSPLVSNATRTQTYVAGVDYTLTVLGTSTRLQRLVGGRILDGETVLADYTYDVGGTYAYHEFDQTLNLSWNLSRYLNLFFVHFSAAPILDSGNPTFALNQVKSNSYSLRGDLPTNVGLAISLGGGLEFEDRHETISPFRRSTADIYLQTDEPLFALGYFRASMRRNRIEYETATQNSDVHGYELRYWSRYLFGMNVTAALSGERDDAGLTPHHRTDESVGVQWQQRKFTLTSSLVRTKEDQAGVQRNRTTFQIFVRRDLW